MTKRVTYEPDNSLKRGYFATFNDIFQELWENRWLTWQLFKRDFFSMYKQSFIGVLWAIIIPLVSVSTFIVLNRSGIFSIGNLDVPYPTYALLGMAFWQLFSTGLIQGSNALTSAGAMITKINFSKKALVIAALGKTLVTFLIQIAMVAILYGLYGTLPNKIVVLIPLVILPMVLLTIGLSFFFSLINAVVRDVSNMISTLMTFLMFLTPVLYAKPTSGILAVATKYNPLYYLVSAPRDLALYGKLSEPKGFLIASFVSVIVFLFCIFIFHLTETRVTERV